MARSSLSAMVDSDGVYMSSDRISFEDDGGDASVEAALSKTGWVIGYWGTDNWSSFRPPQQFSSRLGRIDQQRGVYVRRFKSLLGSSGSLQEIHLLLSDFLGFNPTEFPSNFALVIPFEAFKRDLDEHFSVGFSRRKATLPPTPAPTPLSSHRAPRHRSVDTVDTVRCNQSTLRRLLSPLKRQLRGATTSSPCGGRRHPLAS
ncbi:hypothetical protein PIB30_021097 [Stylosanthes scabra]|uniref:Uncharacterized protein n=1 Tax=Stylosanthes scabra TaxID=79078 RepID=A0ABU6Y8E4_9FABA|nr:hypothetical protein [Stylosanthes scabra]